MTSPIFQVVKPLVPTAPQRQFPLRGNPSLATIVTGQELRQRIVIRDVRCSGQTSCPRLSRFRSFPSFSYLPACKN
jgi:hypothetical protein